MKLPQRYVRVSYSVFEPPLRNAEQCEPKVQIQPLTNFAQVPIVVPTIAFKELQADGTLTMLMPQQPLYPTSKFHVPVYVYQRSAEGRLILSFTMKVRVKAGIRVLSATPFNEMWNISFEKENQKHTTVRVTAVRKDSKLTMQTENAGHEDMEMANKNNYTHSETSSEKYEREVCHEFIEINSCFCVLSFVGLKKCFHGCLRLQMTPKN